MTATVPLSEVAEINPRCDTDGVLATDAVDFFPMAVVDADKTVARASERRALQLVSKSFTSFRDGDVLLAKITPCFENGKIFQASVTTPVAFGSTEFHVVRCGAKLDGRYLVHFLRRQEVRSDGERKMTGSGGQRRVPKHFLESLGIPLPPIPEQRRIAAILDKADALRAKRREALAQLDRLAQSIFVEMFGDLMSPTAPWSPVPVSGFVAGFESGKSVAAEDEENSSSQYRVLKVSAVTSLEYKPSESKAAPPRHVPQDSHFVRQGDLLFSRANTTELIGATAYVSQTPDHLLLPDKLWRFIWHESPRAAPHFVNFLFRQPKFRAEIGRRASGSSGSMKNISQEKVLSIEVALPPLALQEVFSKRIEKVMRMKAAQVPCADALDTLFATLQHRAFRGEL